MKTKNNYTKKDIISYAYSLLMSDRSILQDYYKCLDMRYNFSIDVMTFINQIKNSIDLTKIEALREKRRESKPSKFINIYNQPLVLDWLASKGSIKYIYKTCISFYGSRKHHAKNEFDIKILNILSKHHKLSL